MGLQKQDIGGVAIGLLMACIAHASFPNMFPKQQSLSRVYGDPDWSTNILQPRADYPHRTPAGSLLLFCNNYARVSAKVARAVAEGPAVQPCNSARQ